MGSARRVVTGLNSAGKSTVVCDDYLPEHADGGLAVTIFSSESSATVPLRQLTAEPVHPRDLPPSASSWIVIQFPPNDSPYAQTGRLHTTDTIDYLVVRSGELTMLLDDEVEVVLKPGDFLVQGGVAHGWLNRRAEPCVAECILVGLPREKA